MLEPQELERYRSRIWALCYRITGVAADADELVQETFMRALESGPREAAADLLPWLVRVATNASRDVLRRRKRQPYVGEWLPAPIEDGALDGELAAPDARYCQAESLSFAFLIALEALSPTQRAVLILRDVLGYSVREVASTLSLSEPNVKTTHHRARHALEQYEREREDRATVSLERARDAATRFLMQVSSGQVATLAQLLAADARAINDGGGEFLAALRPIISSQRVARFFLGVSRQATLVEARALTLNGLPALFIHGRPDKARAAEKSVHLFELNRTGEIARVYSVLATRKIAHLMSTPSPAGRGSG